MTTSSDRGGVTLVLGGGGFKGLAHAGVLQVLQRASIPVDGIVGTSAGALVGAMYCSLGDADAVVARALRFSLSGEFLQRMPAMSSGNGGRLTASLVGRLLAGLRRQMALERMFRRPSAFGAAPLRHAVALLVPDVRIESLPIPLAIGALDLVLGHEILITAGDLRSAVTGSSAVPGFFPPVARDGHLLCDAGLVDNLPTRQARSLGAVRIVAVDLNSALPPAPASAVGLDVLLRSQDIATRLANRRRADHADVVLSPDLAERGWLDAGDPASIIAAGAAAAEGALPAIEALLAARAGGTP